MSFASGLFSFLGGASSQFRQEVDLANQYKIDQAKLEAEQVQQYNELLFEQQKHNDNINIQQQGIDLDRAIHDHNKYVFGLEHQLSVDQLGFERAKWGDEYKMLIKNHDLKIKDINNKIPKIEIRIPEISINLLTIKIVTELANFFISISNESNISLCII